MYKPNTIDLLIVEIKHHQRLTRHFRKMAKYNPDKVTRKQAKKQATEEARNVRSLNKILKGWLQ